MKRIGIIRHAKSSWKDSSLSDLERPLKNRGREDALLVSSFLLRKDLTPQLIVSSPATRAQQTAKIFADTFAYSKEIMTDERVYFQGTQAILNLIKELDPALKSVFIFGHQPIISDVYTQLTGSYLEHMPTSGASVIDFEVNKWEEIEIGEGLVQTLVYPSLLKEKASEPLQ